MAPQTLAGFSRLSISSVLSWIVIWILLLQIIHRSLQHPLQQMCKARTLYLHPPTLLPLRTKRYFQHIKKQYPQHFVEVRISCLLLDSLDLLLNIESNPLLSFAHCRIYNSTFAYFSIHYHMAGKCFITFITLYSRETLHSLFNQLASLRIQVQCNSKLFYSVVLSVGKFVQLAQKEMDTGFIRCNRS